MGDTPTVADKFRAKHGNGTGWVPTDDNLNSSNVIALVLAPTIAACWDCRATFSRRGPARFHARTHDLVWTPTQAEADKVADMWREALGQR